MKNFKKYVLNESDKQLYKILFVYSHTVEPGYRLRQIEAKSIDEGVYLYVSDIFCVSAATQSTAQSKAQPIAQRAAAATVYNANKTIGLFRGARNDPVDNFAYYIVSPESKYYIDFESFLNNISNDVLEKLAVATDTSVLEEYLLHLTVASKPDAIFDNGFLNNL